VICKRHLTVLTVLMNKVEFYGIDGKFKPLIKSYLTGRQQRVVLGSKSTKEHTSKWEIIKSRVSIYLPTKQPTFFPH
jgi:hypothetical protein